jgi:hypothetical protein
MKRIRSGQGHFETRQAFGPGLHVGDVGEPHRRAIAISDHEGPVVRRVVGLIIRVELIVPPALLNGAFGTVGIGRCQRGAHVLEADSVFEQSHGIELDANRKQRRTADDHLTNPIHLREALLDDVACRIVELAADQGLGRQRQDQDWTVGGIHFPSNLDWSSDWSEGPHWPH